MHNVLSNLGTPVELGNDILEAKPRRAGDTTMRFLINTTLGVVGMFDVAKDLGYPDHDNDFGMTLALWGVPEGPFLFLPVLGPTNPRDAIGHGVDVAGDPFTWVGQGTVVTALDWTRFSLNVIDQRAQVLDTIESIKKTALDPYATFRSLYRQHRRAADRAGARRQPRHHPDLVPAAGGGAELTERERPHAEPTCNHIADRGAARRSRAAGCPASTRLGLARRRGRRGVHQGDRGKTGRGDQRGGVARAAAPVGGRDHRYRCRCRWRGALLPRPLLALGDPGAAAAGT